MANLETQPATELILIRRSRRVRHDYTLYSLAQKLNRSTFWMHCVETGKTRPSSKEAKAIARYLKCDVATLFSDLE